MVQVVQASKELLLEASTDALEASVQVMRRPQQ